MIENNNLSSELKQLKRNFHAKLANKRGLFINDNDLLKISEASNDMDVQNHFERVSFVRRMLSLFKKEEEKAL